MYKFIKVMQIRSTIGCIPKHRAIILSLGLKHIGHTVTLKLTPSINGMIKKINYMIRVFYDN